MRFYLCVLFPLIHTCCAIESPILESIIPLLPSIYPIRQTMTIQTVMYQLLGFAFVVGPLWLLLTCENIVRIRRAWLLTRLARAAQHGLLGAGFGASGDILWLQLARFHLCSAVAYTSLIDHLQDSLFILAVVLAATPIGFTQIVGLTMTSTVALCGKLVWCRLYLGSPPPIKAALEDSELKVQCAS